MKRKLILWTISVSAVVCLMLIAMQLFKPGPNLILNGDFESGLDKWWWYVRPNSGAQANFSAENIAGSRGSALRVVVDQAAAYDDIEISQGHVPTKATHNYTATFRARSSVAQEIELKLIKNADPWTPYGFLRTIHVTTEWKLYKLSGRATVTAEDGKLMFHFNHPDARIWIDDVTFRESGGGL